MKRSLPVKKASLRGLLRKKEYMSGRKFLAEEDELKNQYCTRRK